MQKPQWTLEGFTGDMETVSLHTTPLVLQRRTENREREARHKKLTWLDAEMTRARLLDSAARVSSQQQEVSRQLLGEGLRQAG